MFVSERAKEFHAVIKRIGDCAGGDYGAERMSVADWFSEHDDIRDDAVFFKCIEVRARASKSCFHFIRDTNPAGTTHSVVDVIQITIREDDLSGDARHRFRDE